MPPPSLLQISGDPVVESSDELLHHPAHQPETLLRPLLPDGDVIDGRREDLKTRSLKEHPSPTHMLGVRYQENSADASRLQEHPHENRLIPRHQPSWLRQDHIGRG